MASTEADVTTENASRYLQQLCKHWGHKFEVSFDPQHGTIRLDTSKLTLDAKDGHLLMKLENDDPATLARHTGVVTDHLKRFAFREDLAVEWQTRTAA